MEYVADSLIEKVRDNDDKIDSDVENVADSESETVLVNGIEELLLTSESDSVSSLEKLSIVTLRCCVIVGV